MENLGGILILMPSIYVGSMFSVTAIEKNNEIALLAVVAHNV